MKRRSYAKRRDENEPEIVKALIGIGATVERLDKFDLLVGYKGVDVKLEVKNLAGKNQITSDQFEFMSKWKGSPLYIVHSPHAAVAVVKRAAASAQNT